MMKLKNILENYKVKSVLVLQKLDSFINRAYIVPMLQRGK